MLKLITVIMFIMSGAGLLCQENDGYIMRGESLNSIEFNSSGYGVSVGDNGALYYTTNSGQVWLITNSGTINTLNNSSSTLENILLVAGNNGTLLRSEDMGLTWYNVELTTGGRSSTGDFLSVALASGGKGFLCGLNGILMMTTDFGVTWESMDVHKNSDLLSVAMYDDNNGIMTGSLNTILYTTNGGANWNPPGSSLSVQVDYNYVAMTSATTAYAVTSKGHIVKTTDTGNSWQIVYEDSLLVPLNKIESVPAGNKIAAIGNGGKILISTDGGASWKREITGTNEDLNCICFQNDMTGFAGGKNGIMLKTTDGGLKWSQVDYLPYASKGNTSHNTENPGGLSVGQNYPNPFNPATTISFTIGREASVNIKIFDLAGREISKTAFGVLPAGTHKFNFDGSNISSGIYFYQVWAQTNGNAYIETKKMILTK